MVNATEKRRTLIHGKCDGCKKTAWTNWANRLSTSSHLPGYYCDDCYDRMSIRDRPQPTCKAATKDGNNPWQDNAIRAMEGD